MGDRLGIPDAVGILLQRFPKPAFKTFKTKLVKYELPLAQGRVQHGIVV